MFYNYVYVNPKRPGRFVYPNINFSLLYEPIYVGKGKGKRFVAHILDTKRNSEKNPHKHRKIMKLNKMYNMIDYIVIVNQNTPEVKSFENEIDIITSIGRRNLKTGPLLNLNDGGAGGNHNRGKTWSVESNKSKGDFCRGKTYEELYGAKKSNELKKQRAKVFREAGKKRIGELNPFYGKTHSEEVLKKLSDKAKQQMKNNHPSSKNWTIIDQNGTKYITRNLKSFCQEHELSFSVMKNFRNKGKINFDSYSKGKRNRCLNSPLTSKCVNWEIRVEK